MYAVMRRTGLSWEAQDAMTVGRYRLLLRRVMDEARDEARAARETRGISSFGDAVRELH